MYRWNYSKGSCRGFVLPGSVHKKWSSLLVIASGECSLDTFNHVESMVTKKKEKRNLVYNSFALENGYHVRFLSAVILEWKHYFRNSPYEECSLSLKNV